MKKGRAGTVAEEFIYFVSSRRIYFIACLVTSLGPTARASDGNNCQLEKLAEIPARVTSDATLLMKGSMKGTAQEFIVDTDEQYTIFDKSILDDFSISYGSTPIYLVTPKKEYQLYKNKIPGLMFGNLDVSNLSFYVTSSKLRSDGHYANIGVDFLENFDLDFDLKNGQIDLFKHYVCKTEPVYWDNRFSEADAEIRDHQIYIAMTINDTKTFAILDTSMPHTLVTWDLARRLGLDESSAGMREANDLNWNKELRVKKFHFDNIKIGDEEIKNSELPIIKAYLLNADAIIGLDFIKAHHIFISRDKRQMYFTWNGTPIFSGDDHGRRQPNPAASPAKP